jgi:hypothetical protein
MLIPIIVARRTGMAGRAGLHRPSLRPLVMPVCHTQATVWQRADSRAPGHRRRQRDRHSCALRQLGSSGRHIDNPFGVRYPINRHSPPSALSQSVEFSRPP